MTETLLQKLTECGIPAERDVSLSAHSTFRIGGKADFFLRPQSEAALLTALSLLQDAAVSFRIVGHGSNLLYDDAGYRGAIVTTGGIKEVRLDGVRLTAGCGAALPHLSSRAAEAGLGGLAFACGIPGTLGGAVAMNAGAFGGEMASLLESAVCYDIKTAQTVALTAADLSFGNRDSLLRRRRNLILLSATLTLHPQESDEIRAEMAAYTARRRASQPLSYPSAGSVFKRPAGTFAGKLIECCGLKGYRIGGAQVSALHAGFIVNVGGATADDVDALIRHIQRTVFDHFGVSLEPEIERIPASESAPG